MRERTVDWTERWDAPDEIQRAAARARINADPRPQARGHGVGMTWIIAWIIASLCALFVLGNLDLVEQLEDQFVEKPVVDDDKLVDDQRGNHGCINF